MKIAYVNELPQQDQLLTFIQAYTAQSTNNDAASTAELQLQNPQYVISAYDNDALIGIGCCMQEHVDIHVLPAYRHREIECNVNKLLQAESRFCKLAAR